MPEGLSEGQPEAGSRPHEVRVVTKSLLAHKINNTLTNHGA